MEEGPALAFVIFYPPDLHTIRRVGKTQPTNISADRFIMVSDLRGAATLAILSQVSDYKINRSGI